MENHTKNGLLFLIIGLLLSTISTGLTGLYYYFNANETVGNLFGIIGFGFISGIGGLLALVGAILFLIGRKEFDELHQKYVIYALITLVIGIIISGIISGIGVFTSVVQSISNQGEAQLYWAGYSILISTILGSITGSLAYVFALYHLENETGRRILYFGFIVSLIIAVLIGFLSMDVIDTLITTIPIDESPVDFTSSFTYTSRIAQYSALGTIANILWLIALYIPYKRINDGELIPRKNLLGSQQYQPDRVCPNCQKEIPNDAKVCPYCGKNFDSYI